jgi:hypothetical protein
MSAAPNPESRRIRRFHFGALPGDPLIDQLLSVLRQAGAAGMTRTQIHRRIGSDRGGALITRALSVLEQSGKAKRVARPGSWAEVWAAV